MNLRTIRTIVIAVLAASLTLVCVDASRAAADACFEGNPFNSVSHVAVGQQVPSGIFEPTGGDKFSGTIHWGDGTSSPFTVNQSVRHAYEQANTYQETFDAAGTVQLCLIGGGGCHDDACANTGTLLQTLVVGDGGSGSPTTTTQPDACAGKNFWGLGPDWRELAREKALDAHNAAQAGADEAKFVDLFGRLIDLAFPPGSKGNAEGHELKDDLEKTKLAWDVVDVGTQANLVQTTKAAVPVLTTEEQLAADQTQYNWLKVQLAKKVTGTKKDVLRGVDRATATAQRKELSAAIAEAKPRIGTLKSQYADELTNLARAHVEVDSVNAFKEAASKFFTKMAGSSAPVLKILGTFLGKISDLETILQVPGAAGILVWAPVAGILVALSHPPKGCTREPYEPAGVSATTNSAGGG